MTGGKAMRFEHVKQVETVIHKWCELMGYQEECEIRIFPKNEKIIACVDAIDDKGYMHKVKVYVGSNRFSKFCDSIEMDDEEINEFVKQIENGK